MRDFTIEIYKELLGSLIENNYSFYTFREYILQLPSSKAVVLRHDVDQKPLNSLRFARIENQLNLKGTYYFRVVPESFNRSIIKEISSLEHEIGYHYEDLTVAKGDDLEAIKLFQKNLMQFREICNVNTICMHGSPLSKYDNKDIWEKYDYKQYGVIAEPYFDLDINRVLYITDTGRGWNKGSGNRRDFVNSKFNIRIKNTTQLIDLIKKNELSDHIMINFHPQRWSDSYSEWITELIFQNVKNVIKNFLR